MKITLVTPSFNQGQFIEDTIKSVITQEGNFDLEYIIMDSCSTDNTLSVIKKYDTLIKSKFFTPQCKSLKFIWFSEKDTGQSNAINKAFKICKGEIVNWLCSDDLLEKGTLKKVVTFFSNNPQKNIVFGDAICIDQFGKEQGVLRGKDFTREELLRSWDRFSNTFFLPQPSTFFRKFLINDFGYFNEENHLCMDYEWYLKVNKIHKFYYFPEALSSARFHDNCKSIKFLKKQSNMSFELSRKYWEENYLHYALSYYFFIFIKYPIGSILKPILPERVFWLLKHLP